MCKTYRLILALVIFCGFLPGCELYAVKEQHQEMASYCRLSGSVRPEQDDGKKIIVVLLKFNGGDFQKRENWQLFDHFVDDRPGKWNFVTSPGNYLITAFIDANGDQIFQPSEPAIPADPKNLLQCAPGEIKTGIELVIREQDRFNAQGPVDISKMQVRSSKEQMNISLGQALHTGEIAQLSEPRFAPEIGSQGMWRPLEFLLEGYAGIYFLEPYSTEKIPVLFVHGISGTPRDFSYITEHLDRAHFQPWFVYYPSGGYLDNIANAITQMLVQMQSRYQFQKIAVIAHSMGGLVARNFIFKYLENAGNDSIPLFVSISTPWNGQSAAKLGVEHLSDPVYSWKAMAPGSAYLTELFYTSDKPQAPRRMLPQTMAKHLLFGFIEGEAGDGTVSLASELRTEAQEEATRIYGYRKSHMAILTTPETSTVLNKLLESVR